MGNIQVTDTDSNIKYYGVSAGQIGRLKKNMYVSTHTIEMMCAILGCSVEEVMEVVHETPEEVETIHKALEEAETIHKAPEEAETRLPLDAGRIEQLPAKPPCSQRQTRTTHEGLAGTSGIPGRIPHIWRRTSIVKSSRCSHIALWQGTALYLSSSLIFSLLIRLLMNGRITPGLSSETLLRSFDTVLS